MGKVVGIDYGTKRTGIAITDEMQIIASALTTISTSSIDKFLANLILKEDIDCFVVGYPINLDGSTTNNTHHVNGFIKRLNKIYNIPVYKTDERFTSKIAKQTILDAGMKRKKRRDKRLIDKVSAAIILQDYLNNRS